MLAEQESGRVRTGIRADRDDDERERPPLPAVGRREHHREGGEEGDIPLHERAGCQIPEQPAGSGDRTGHRLLDETPDRHEQDAAEHRDELAPGTAVVGDRDGDHRGDHGRDAWHQVRALRSAWASS